LLTQDGGNGPWPPRETWVKTRGNLGETQGLEEATGASEVWSSAFGSAEKAGSEVAIAFGRALFLLD
jgi:hypothetical protein